MVSSHASDVHDSIFALESIRVVIDSGERPRNIYILTEQLTCWTLRASQEPKVRSLPNFFNH